MNFVVRNSKNHPSTFFHNWSYCFIKPAVTIVIKAENQYIDNVEVFGTLECAREPVQNSNQFQNSFVINAGNMRGSSTDPFRNKFLPTVAKCFSQKWPRMEAPWNPLNILDPPLMFFPNILL